jgi:antitoxin component YwqK of YwqJK toxin-antitoxin module
LLRSYVFILIIAFFISCNQNGEEKLSNPLVLKDGLLYSDSLSTTPYSGRNKSRMLDMKIEFDVVNGIKDGDFIIYYPNDTIQIAGKMKDNKNVGEWKYYFQNGILQTSGYYDNDIPTGKWMWFSTDGKLIEEGNYLNGMRDGEWKNYDSSGMLDIIRLYKDNRLMDSSRIK